MKRRNAEQDNGVKKSKFVSSALLRVGGKVCVGLDEVGLASSVSSACVAAVILPYDFVVPNGLVIRDSKMLNHKQKDLAFDYIKKHALAYSVQWVTKETIDEFNVFNGKMKGWHMCLDDLNQKGFKFDLIVVDGNLFHDYKYKGKTYKHRCVVKGDDKYLQIAAASILAKVTRDRYIRQLAEDYPELQERYGIAQNVGYPVKKHKEGLHKYGYTQFHRKSLFKKPEFKGLKLNPVRHKSENKSVECDGKQEIEDIYDMCFIQETMKSENE